MRISTRALAAAGIALAFSPLYAETASAAPAQTVVSSQWSFTCNAYLYDASTHTVIARKTVTGIGSDRSEAYLNMQKQVPRRWASGYPAACQYHQL